MNKKLIIICVAVAVVAAGIGVGIAVSKSKNADNAPQTAVSEQTESKADEVTENNVSEEQEEVKAETEKQPEAAEEVKVNPTFMYFVDNAQESKTADMINELKAKYPNVNFDIKNVEKNPEILNNFELVKDKTPALIMLDTSNNICGFEFMCSDKAKLEASIKMGLGE